LQLSTVALESSQSIRSNDNSQVFSRISCATKLVPWQWEQETLFPTISNFPSSAGTSGGPLLGFRKTARKMTIASTRNKSNMSMPKITARMVEEFNSPKKFIASS
jgi:hypothetical protein